MQITLTIDEAEKSRVIDAFVTAFNYQDEIDDPEKPGETIPNPESKAEMVDRETARYVKDVVRAQEKRIAEEAHRAGHTDVDVT